MRTVRILLCFWIAAILQPGAIAAESAPAPATSPWLTLPTENDALFRGKPAQFYMFVERDFEGKKTRPWEGGMYGFTRSPRHEGGRIVFTRFHEGIDIAPVRRDAKGEPLDPVRAAATGRVVHVANDAGSSNYGRYIVIEHIFDGSPYYTLYAHLGAVHVQPGQRVRQGEKIAILGYTGRGINKERAHLHFEFCMKASRNFGAWFDQYMVGNINHHGIYNGMNLLGMDPAALLKGVRANPALTVPQFVRSQRPLFSLVVPNSAHFELPRMYPWLLVFSEAAAAPPAAWRVTFSETIIPMKIEPETNPGAPRVRWLGEGVPALVHQSRGLVTGSKSAPRLTESGARFAHLLTFPDSLP